MNDDLKTLVKIRHLINEKGKFLSENETKYLEEMTARFNHYSNEFHKELDKTFIKVSEDKTMLRS